MFLDLLNDLFINSTVFYIYFGMFLITLGLSQFSVMRGFSWKMHATIHVKDALLGQSRIDDRREILTAEEVILHWFVKSFKRIDTVDDDEADHSNPYFSFNFQIRRGYICRRIAHLQPKVVALY